MAKKYKIFLASSEELVDDRIAFDLFISKGTKLWNSKNIFFELIIWEDFLDSMSNTSKQDDYNRAIKECDIFVLLFFTKVGKYTEKEFESAYMQFKTYGKPLIFTYFKEADINTREIDERVLTMLNFKKRLSMLEHFYSVYENKEGLQLHFSNQLAILDQKKFFAGEEIDHDWLNAHLTKVKKNFVQYMLPYEKITEGSTEKARALCVELLVQKRKQITPTGQEKNEEHGKQAFPFSELIKQEKNRFLIFGDGGGGKTTSLLKLACDIADRIPSDPTLPIPLYIKLNNFDTTKQSLKGILKLASDAANMEHRKFEAIFRDGTKRFLFLLDGFNEVGDRFQEDCTKALRQFVKGTHYYMITSRTISRAEQLRTQIDNIDLFDLIHLEENQIKDFLGRHNVVQLYEQMGDQLKGLAQNPFMLWALIQSLSGVAAEKLPNNIGQLYQGFIDQYIFVEREQNKVPSYSKYNYSLVKKPVLASLSIKMNSEGITKIIETDELRKYLLEQLKRLQAENEGLVDFEPYEFMPPKPSGKGFLDETVHNDVLRRVGNSLQFMHQSVQDYFTATALANLPVNEVVNLAPRLRSRYINRSDQIVLPDGGNFSEPLRLLAGMLDNSEELLLQLNSRNSLLAAKCASATSNLKIDIKRKLIHSWQNLLKKESHILKYLGCLCFSYSEFGDETVIEMLLNLVKNESRPNLVRKTAAEAIGKIGHPDDIEVIIDVALSEEEENFDTYNWGSILNSIDSQIVVQKLYKSSVDMSKVPAFRKRGRLLLEHIDKIKIENAFADRSNERIHQIVDECLEFESGKEGDNYYANIIKKLNVKKVVPLLFNKYCQPNQKEEYYEKIRHYLYVLEFQKLKIELDNLINRNLLDGNNERTQKAKELLAKYEPSYIDLKTKDKLILEIGSAAKIFIQNIDIKEQLLYKKMKTFDIGELQETLQSENYDERRAAIKILGQIDSDISHKMLINHFELENDPSLNKAIIEVWRNFLDKSEILTYFKVNITNPDYNYLFDVDSDFMEEVSPNTLPSDFTRLFKNRIDVDFERETYIYRVTKNHWSIKKFNPERLFEIRKGSGTTFGIYDLNRKLNLIELTQILDDKIIPYLLELIDKKEHPTIRKSTILALSRFKKFDIIPVIYNALDFEKETEILKLFIQILGDTNSEKAIVPLLMILENVGLKGSTEENDLYLDRDLQNSSWNGESWVEPLSEALRKINDQTKVWQSLKDLFDESKDEVKLFTLTLIADLVVDRQELKEVLELTLKNENPQLRKEGIKILDNLKYQRIEGTLLEIAVADDSEEVRKAAVYALRFRDDDNILTFFIELLEGNDIRKQQYSVFALGELMDDAASEPLEKFYRQTKKPGLKILTAEVLKKIGNYESSILLLDRLCPLIDIGDKGNVIREATGFLLQIPEGDQIFYGPVQESLTIGDFKKTIQSAEERMLIFPEDSNLYWLRGIAYQSMKLYKEALLDYDKVLELVPKNAIADIYAYRATVLGEGLSRYEDAYLTVQTAAERDPNRADIQADLGWYAYKSGHFEESVAASTRALELEPKAPMSAFNLGLALLVLEQLEKAKDAYNQGIKICDGLAADIAKENFLGALGDLDELLTTQPNLKPSVKKCKEMLSKAYSKL